MGLSLRPTPACSMELTTATPDTMATMATIWVRERQRPPLRLSLMLTPAYYTEASTATPTTTATMVTTWARGRLGARGRLRPSLMLMLASFTAITTLLTPTTTPPTTGLASKAMTRPH